MASYDVHWPTLMSVSKALATEGEASAGAAVRAEQGSQEARAASGGGPLAAALAELSAAFDSRGKGVTAEVMGAGERLSQNALRYSYDDAGAAASLRNTFTGELR